MKTFKVLIILIAMLSFSAYADSDSSTTYTVEVTQSSDPHIVNDGPVRHRTPPRPLICTISPNGINIQSVNTEEIIAYDIYDTEGGCNKARQDEGVAELSFCQYFQKGSD